MALSALLLILLAAGPAHAFSPRSLLSKRGRGLRATKVVLPPPEKPKVFGTAQPMPSTTRVMTTPTDCSGYAQPRVYLESQAWFTPDQYPDSPLADNINTKSVHLHIGACVPHRRWIAGYLGLQILLQKHNFPLTNSSSASDVSLMLQFEWNSKNTTVKWASYAKSVSAWNCTLGTDGSNLCKQVVTVMLPTRLNTTIVSDGLNEMRLEAKADVNAGIPGQVNKKTLTARFTSWLVVNNNRNTSYPEKLLKPLKLTQLANFVSPWGYTHAEYLDEPLGLMTGRPVNGTIALQTNHRAEAKTANVTSLLVAVDPNFHREEISLGSQVAYFPTPDMLPRPMCAPANVSWAVNCKFEKANALLYDTRVLDDAYIHKMFSRTDSFIPSSDPLITALNAGKKPASMLIGGTVSGIFLIAFRTNNTGAAPVDPLPSLDDLGTDPNDLPGPPPGFSPPDNVTVFDGSQVLPGTNTTYNLAAAGWRCSKDWLEPRVYLEAQTWLTFPGADINGESKHLHIGACLPERQKIAGKFPVDILLQKHDFAAGDGQTVSIKVTFDWNKDLKRGNITYMLTQSATPANWACSTDGKDCRALYTAWIDTKPSSGQWLVPDGINKLILEAETSLFDGNSTRTIVSRLTSNVVVANNRDTDISNARLLVQMLSKTKDPWAYTHAEMLDPLPLGPQQGVVPFASTHFILTQLSNITGAFITVDPSFHKAGGPDVGKVQLAVTAADRPDLCPVDPSSKHVNCGRVPIEWNTTQFANGVHRIFFRTDSFVAPDDAIFEAINAKLGPGAKVGAGTFSSVLMVTVEANNPPPPPPPPPQPPVDNTTTDTTNTTTDTTNTTTTDTGNTTTTDTTNTTGTAAVQNSVRIGSRSGAVSAAAAGSAAAPYAAAAPTAAPHHPRRAAARRDFATAVLQAPKRRVSGLKVIEYNP